MMAIAMLDDNTFIGAENWHNIFCLVKNAGATSDEERARLETTGLFHLGGTRRARVSICIRVCGHMHIRRRSRAPGLRAL